MLLAKQPTLEEVFRKTQESVGSTADPRLVYAVLIGAVALVILLATISSFKKRQARPRAVNHSGRLLKEVLRSVPLKGGELKQLKTLATEQELPSPLLLVLCPSLLAKAISGKTKADKKVVMQVARKMGVVKPRQPATTET